MCRWELVVVDLAVGSGTREVADGASELELVDERVLEVEDDWAPVEADDWAPVDADEWAPVLSSIVNLAAAEAFLCAESFATSSSLEESNDAVRFFLFEPLIMLSLVLERGTFGSFDS
jgi:hypothetical protein